MPPQTIKLCSVTGCPNPSRRRGWCSMHYKRWQTTGVLGGPEHQRTGPPKSLPRLCSEEGCTAFVVAKELCSAHYLKTMPSGYNSWKAMKRRCYDPKFRQYHRYGGRGITVCGGWLHSFGTFLADMGERPAGLTLDRIDNDGNYSCGHCDECIEKGWSANCRWATYLMQAHNR